MSTKILAPEVGADPVEGWIMSASCREPRVRGARDALGAPRAAGNVGRFVSRGAA